MSDDSDFEVFTHALGAMNAGFKSLLMLMTFAYLFRRHRYRSNSRRVRRAKKYFVSSKIPRQLDHIRNLTLLSDITCINQLRMSRDTFSRLCFLLENLGGLQPTRYLQIPEQVSIFLSILAHHKKIRVVMHDFDRSGHTISTHFHSVLRTLISLHTVLLVQPSPIAEDEESERWKWFKGCLGALDGTYIPVLVPAHDKPRYRNRKGVVSVNVLGVCDRNMNFVYVLTGWEGSAADGRVLRDAISRPNGLKVPIGNFYLCDGGYTNGDGFLAPYRGVRYHLQEWQHASQVPQTPQEYYNLLHARARNVIERCFGLLKARWGILRSNSFYPIKVQNTIILACCLLHNFIHTNATIDPMECEVPDFFPNPDFEPPEDIGYVAQVESSSSWTARRELISLDMWAHRHT